MDVVQKNIIFAAGTLVLALYLGYQSFSYPPESALFPRALAVLLGGLSALFFLRQIIIAKNRAAEAADSSTPSNEDSKQSGEDISALRSAGLVFGSIGLYTLFILLINYEAATVIFLAAMMLVLGFARKRWILVIACGLMLLLWAIFFHMLGVTRPDSFFFG